MNRRKELHLLLEKERARKSVGFRSEEESSKTKQQQSVCVVKIKRFVGKNNVG